MLKKQIGFVFIAFFVCCTFLLGGCRKPPAAVKQEGPEEVVREAIQALVGPDPGRYMALLDVPEESRNMLKRAWIGMNQILAQYMADGHLNPVTAIFLLKNHFEYKDQTETVVIKKDPYETGNPEEIARKYLTGMAPGLAAPPEIAPENKPLIETVVIDQTGTVE